MITDEEYERFQAARLAREARGRERRGTKYIQVSGETKDKIRSGARKRGISMSKLVERALAEVGR